MRTRPGESEIRTPIRSRFGGALSLTLVSGIGLVLILGLLFSVTRWSEQINHSALQLHDADESLRAATVVRAHVGLATYMITTDEAFGTNSAGALDVALSEARTALGDLRRGLTALEEDDSPDVLRAVEILHGYAATSERALDAIKDGDVERARSISDLHDASFKAIRAGLDDVRGRLAQTVGGSDELLGRIGNVTLFLVAFLVPAAVIFIYRQLLLKQARQAELESRLESERRLNAAREEFIANASHELRTPLTAISGFAQILVDESAIVSSDPLSDTASELLRWIVAESQDLTRMVEDLLTTARLDAHALHFDFAEVAIDEVVGEVIDPLIGVGVEITSDCEPATVRTDRLRTRQVLRNLISNARKYGGSTIEVLGRIDGNTYRCDVIDDGDGIPQHLAGRMFERFVHRGGQTAVSGSVGLGLSIVHALVEGMDGSIGYRRLDGRTFFTVRFPLSDGNEISPLALDTGRRRSLSAQTSDQG